MNDEGYKKGSARTGSGSAIAPPHIKVTAEDPVPPLEFSRPGIGGPPDPTPTVYLRIADGLGVKRYVGLTIHGAEGFCLDLPEAIYLVSWLWDWIEKADPQHIYRSGQGGA